MIAPTKMCRVLNYLVMPLIPTNFPIHIFHRLKSEYSGCNSYKKYYSFAASKPKYFYIKIGTMYSRDEMLSRDLRNSGLTTDLGHGW